MSEDETRPLRACPMCGSRAGYCYDLPSSQRVGMWGKRPDPISVPDLVACLDCGWRVNRAVAQGKVRV